MGKGTLRGKIKYFFEEIQKKNEYPHSVPISHKMYPFVEKIAQNLRALMNVKP